jgi:hypothetical protein
VDVLSWRGTGGVFFEMAECECADAEWWGEGGCLCFVLVYEPRTCGIWVMVV